MKKNLIFCVGLLLLCQIVTAKTLTVSMQLLDQKDTLAKSIGTIQAVDTRYGVLLTPNLHDLPPGLHGFHVHAAPSCEHHGNAAGTHLDPQHTGKHLGPYNDSGHLGDLPALYVDQTGSASLPILAPRLKVDDLLQHAFIIHQGGDNYADTPEKLGGGGARIACGVIKVAN